MRRAADLRPGIEKSRRIVPVPALAAATVAFWLIAVPAAGNREPAWRAEAGALPSGIPAAPVLRAAQVDSFYLQRLREGVKAYQESRYAEAFKALEIAMFGLAGDKSKLAECLTYAGLGAHHLKNDAKSREYLLRAGALLEDSGIERPSLKETDRDLYEKLLAEFASKAGTAPKQEAAAPAWTAPVSKAPVTAAPATKPPVKKAPEDKARPGAVTPAKAPEAKKPSAAASPAQKPPAESSRPRPAVVSPPPPSTAKKPEPSPIAGLEKRLSADPGNAALIYELAGAYLDVGNAAGARRLLEPYLAKQPEDYGAVFLLAKAEYRLRRFKPAFAGFHALASPRVQGELPPDTAIKSGLYRALCLFRLGDRANLPSAFALASSGIASAALEAAISSEGLAADWAALQKALGR